MSEIKKKESRKRDKLSILDAFRPDYERHDLWSYAEAGEYAGMSPYTIRLWVDQGKFPVSPLKTPYRVIAETFKAFLITGRVEENAGNMQSTT